MRGRVSQRGGIVVVFDERADAGDWPGPRESAAMEDRKRQSPYPVLAACQADAAAAGPGTGREDAGNT